MDRKGPRMALINRIIADESGATAIEYGLIVALIAVGLIASLTALGGSLSGTFNTVSTTMSTANAAA